jgi:hypothetical protein
LAERASVFETSQLGVEVTKGTTVPTTKRLLATGFMPHPVTPLTQFEPMGFKAATTVIQQKEHTEADIKGTLAYNDIVYLASGILTAAVITTPSGATNTRRWNFTPTVTGPDSPVTYTVETGSVAGAERFSFGLVTDFSLRTSETEAAVTGKMLGQALVESITLSTGANAIYTVSTTATGGTFTLTVGANTTGAQAFNVSAAALQTALTGLVSVGALNATVTGNNGGPYTITFVGSLASTPVVLTANGASLTGGVLTLTTVQTGVARTDVPALPADPTSASYWVGNSTTNQQQTVTLNGSPSGGTFKLSLVHPFTGATLQTGTIAYNADGPTVVQTALQAAWGKGTVTVTGASSPWTLTFAGPFAGLQLAPVILDGSALTGGTGGTIAISVAGGLSQLLRVYEDSLDISNRFTPEYTEDSTVASFSNYVERSFDTKAQIVLQHDSVSAALMADLRARTEKFAKKIYWGPVIESGFNYRICWTFPFKFMASTRGDKSDVWTGTYDLCPIYDSTFGTVITLEVDNNLQSL